MDFTLDKYKSLINTLKKNDFKFFTLKDYVLSSDKISNIDQSIILRHDVDKNPKNSYKMAQIENALGIKGSYYFRIVQDSYNINIMKKIESLGHEIGYHYEDVDLVYKKSKSEFINDSNNEKLIKQSYDSFCKHLEQIREHCDVSTICMHGSPLSKFDNKMIWDKYDYKDLEIIAEPYFDIDFNKFCYFTDTGRRWNGNKVSVRDKVDTKFNFNFKTTDEIINNTSLLPKRIMFTLHPQRWHDNFILNIYEYITQNIKNFIKRIFLVK